MGSNLQVATEEKLQLRPSWAFFVSAYLSNGGNATNAYSIAYPNATLETSRRNGSKLLTKTDIRKGINEKMDEMWITDEYIVASLYRISKMEGHRSPYAAAKALEILARIKGMFNQSGSTKGFDPNFLQYSPMVRKSKQT